MAETKPSVLILDDVEYAHDTFAKLAAKAHVVRSRATVRAEFLEECRGGRFDAVSVIIRTFYSAKRTGLFDQELIQALPPSVQFICHKGAGYDQVDVQACTERRIRVSNTPSAVDDATADTAIWLMIGAIRRFPLGMDMLRKGQFAGGTSVPDSSTPIPPPPKGNDPQGKVLGILGLGGIGKNMAKKAQAFSMKIRYHNRNRLSEEEETQLNVEYVDFDTLLGESDVLSLNLPINAHTRHIINADAFAKMKRGIVIVNTARGLVMDEDALVKAMDDGIVRNVGLDVYEKEPIVHPRLMDNPNVLLLPHLGTWTLESQRNMEELQLANGLMAVEQGRLKTIVPEQRHLQ